MEQITSSYNLFVDSSTGHNAQTKGDDYIVNLQDAGVHAGEGEHIRMSLSNFSMAKNFTDVNENNNEFILGMQNQNPAHGIDAIVKLDNRNYTSVTDLATNFADKIGAQMLAAGHGLTLNAHTGTHGPSISPNCQLAHCDMRRCLRLLTVTTQTATARTSQPHRVRHRRQRQLPRAPPSRQRCILQRR